MAIDQLERVVQRGELVHLETDLRRIWAREVAEFRAKYPGENDISDSYIELFDIGDNPIACMSYGVIGERMVIYYYGTEEEPINYTKCGASYALLALALLRHPDVETIEATGGITNSECFDTAILLGLPPEKAVKKTPLYKMQARMGFSEVVEFSHDNDGFNLTTRLTNVEN